MKHRRRKKPPPTTSTPNGGTDLDGFLGQGGTKRASAGEELSDLEVAMDDAGRPLYPVVPGGERQREMAFRFGVNLVMYTLTGNYKADQVHLPAILKRLGK